MDSSVADNKDATDSDREALLSSIEDVSVQTLREEEAVAVGCCRPTQNRGPLWTKLCSCPKACLEALRGWVKDELIQQVKLAVPLVMTLFFEFSLLVVSLVFIGHQPDKEDTSVDYSAAALATSVINVTGVSVGHGLASAADTLCAQTYGYKNYKKVGVILQRGILILGLTIFIVLFLWLNTESLLLLTKQPACVAKLSSLYVQIYSLSLPFLYLYIMLQRYLQAQSVMWVFVVVGFLANVINIVLHAIFIYGAALGFTGAAVALAISYSTPPLMLLVYLKISGAHKKTWGGWNWQSLQEWWQFMKLAIPGLLMLCWEWWSAEITTFVAGAISETELAVNTVWFQCMVMFYMLPIGISVAVSIRVGNELGAGKPLRAKRAAYVAVAAAVCVAVVYTIILESTRNVIATVFIKGNDEVVHKVAPLMHVACVFLYSDLIQVTVSGVLRGSGRQYIGAIMNFIAYYVIGLPLGITFAFKLDMGALGLWTGMCVGNIVQAVVFIVVLAKTNWEKEARKAMERGRDADDNKEPESVEQMADLESDKNSISLNSCEEQFVPGEVTVEMVSLVKPNQGNTVAEDEPFSAGEHCNHSQPLQSKNKMKLALTKGSFFVLGVAVVVAGGILSYEYHYRLPADAYLNCSIDFLQNQSNESFSSGSTDYYFSSLSSLV